MVETQIGVAQAQPADRHSLPPDVLREAAGASARSA
jgi:hypothetical protein